MFNLVYVHGFGGLDNNPAFAQMAHRAVKKHRFKCRLDIFPWKSQPFELRKAGLLFDQALQEAELAAPLLRHKLDAHESSKTGYYLVGHSLGCLVINKMLSQAQSAFEHCRGIVYLGAAIPKNEPVPATALPPGLRITNYHSPKDDHVLNELYYNKMGISAAGAAGWKMDGVVNYRCSATHGRKGVGVHSDWSNMAWPLLELMAINEGTPTNGGLKANIPARVGKGEDWWNNIIELHGRKISGEESDIYLQQHKFNFDHYRVAVARSGNEKRRRIAWSKAISPLLHEIGLAPDDKEWIFRNN